MNSNETKSLLDQANSSLSNAQLALEDAHKARDSVAAEMASGSVDAVSRLTAVQQIVRACEDDIAAFRIVADHAQRQHQETVAREYRERQEELYHDALAVCDDVCELAGEVDAAFLEFNAKLAELNTRVGDVFKLMRERDKDREKPLFQGMWMLGQSLAWDLENRLHVYRNGDVVREFRCADGYSGNFRNSVRKAR